jgi:hypothetical protein
MGFVTWSLTLREEHRVRVFENRVLRRIFAPKRDEMTGGGENCIMKCMRKDECIQDFGGEARRKETTRKT